MTDLASDMDRLEVAADKFLADYDRLKALNAELIAALEECLELAGRNGPPNEIDACNEIERVARAAIAKAKE